MHETIEAEGESMMMMKEEEKEDDSDVSVGSSDVVETRVETKVMGMIGMLMMLLLVMVGMLVVPLAMVLLAW